ncbi:MAG: phosphoribosyl-ATP diphosphatase [Archaeoglobi archaeon]|nr:phosphoribosyl-ATP diphosphatase [Candidatus Mnemosynella bozhongmuii]
MIEELWEVIGERKRNPREDSYVFHILSHRKGLNKSLEKLGEECIEFILASKDGKKEEIIREGADLLFHFLVSLHALDTELSEILEELRRRRRD